MIEVSIKVKIRPGKKKEFLRLLCGFRSSPGLIDQLRKEKGCLRYHLRKDRDQIDEFYLESEWHNYDLLKAHIQSKYFTILSGAINILCQSPELKISEGSKIISEEALKAFSKIAYF